MYTIRAEDFEIVLPELLPLVRALWAELSAQSTMPMTPDWEVYKAQKERLVCLVARDLASAPIGFWWMFIGPELHNKNSIAAYKDLFYVLPEARSASLFYAFLTKAECLARMVNAQRFFIGDKIAKPLGPLFARKGFAQHETVWVKDLKPVEGLQSE